jgi:hypothetical protein
MKIDHTGNGTRYFSDWRQARRGVGAEVRRIISITRQPGSWAVVAVEHYRGGEAGDVLHDADYPTYIDALVALGDVMESARADGYLTRIDLERVPRATGAAPRPVVS